MNIKHILFIIGLCISFGAVSFLGAQSSVFPGDANNNGRVDHYDLLPIGYAFGQYGPSRITIESTTMPQGIPQTWNQDFATGVNYVHADANGDGLVGIADLALLGPNFGLELDSVQALTYSSTDSPAAAQITLNGGTMLPPFVEGTTVDIPIRFELREDGQTTINGVAFSLQYEATHFTNVQLLLNPGWLLADGAGTSFVRHETGEMHMALTRFGVNPIGESGDIGIIRMIIIDDLVSLLDTPADTLQSDVDIVNIQAYDGNYEIVPVTCPDFALRMYCDLSTGVDDVLPNPLHARLFPNPVGELLEVRSDIPFTRVEIINSKGQRCVNYQGSPLTSWQADVSHLPSGLYVARLFGREATSILKLIRQ